MKVVVVMTPGEARRRAAIARGHTICDGFSLWRCGACDGIGMGGMGCTGCRRSFDELYRKGRVLYGPWGKRWRTKWKKKPSRRRAKAKK